MGRLTSAVLLAALCAHAQDAPVDPLVAMGQWNDAINWVSSIRDPLRRLRDHVVTTYGIAALGGIVCPVDQPLGTVMYREAIEDLNTIPGGNFVESKQVLPVATFSGLWKLTVAAGKKCDPHLPPPSDGARTRRENERREAPTYLDEARKKLSDNPDRAAQLGQAALEAGEPGDIDITSFVTFLDDLRDKAPELADQLFLKAIAFEQESEIPIVGDLAALGDYLFVPSSTTKLADWGDDRDEADPDLVPLYIGAIAGVLGNGAAVDLDPSTAYALATQLLPRARDLALMDADTFEKFLGQPASPGSELPAASSEKATLRRIITQIRRAAEAGHFPEARELLTDVDGVTMRSRTASFIDFLEAAHAARAKDSDRAMALAGKLPGGVKRALLYAGIVASAENRVTAIMALHLGMKDAELLSYEQRIALLSALGTAASGVDRDETQAVLSLLIASLNDANANPRKIKFDPTYFFPFDGPRALVGPDGFVEVVRDNRRTAIFPLKVPHVEAYSLADFIVHAKGVDFMRLQASVGTLRSELQLTLGYVALAKIRLPKKSAKRIALRPFAPVLHPTRREGDPMAYAFGSLVFTPVVKSLQERYGSRRQYARREDSDFQADPIGAAEAEFLGECDSFYMATIGEGGWPYVQHRGGPKGFLKPIDARTIAFADFRGNKQYITTGNLMTDDRVALILVDYPRQARLKVLGRVEILEGAAAKPWLDKLREPGYDAVIERVFVIHVEASDWNCQQHITPRFTAEQIREVLAPVEEGMQKLVRENEELRKKLAAGRS